MTHKVIKREAQYVCRDDVVIVTETLANYHGKPELAGTAQKVTEIQRADTYLAIGLEGIPATGISPGTLVSLLVAEDALTSAHRWSKLPSWLPATAVAQRAALTSTSGTTCRDAATVVPSCGSSFASTILRCKSECLRALCLASSQSQRFDKRTPASPTCTTTTSLCASRIVPPTSS